MNSPSRGRWAACSSSLLGLVWGEAQFQVLPGHLLKGPAPPPWPSPGHLLADVHSLWIDLTLVVQGLWQSNIYYFIRSSYQPSMASFHRWKRQTWQIISKEKKAGAGVWPARLLGGTWAHELLIPHTRLEPRPCSPLGLPASPFC